MSCKRFRAGRLFSCYKALWKYRATSLCIQHCHKFKSSFALKLRRNHILSWRAQLKMQMRGKHNPLPTQNCLFRRRSFSTAALSGCAVPGDLAECRSEPMGRRLSLDTRNYCSEWWNWASESTSEESSRNLNTRCCNKMGGDPI